MSIQQSHLLSEKEEKEDQWDDELPLLDTAEESQSDLAHNYYLNK